MRWYDEFRGVLTGFALIAAVLLGSISFDIGLPGQSILQSLRFHAAAACLVLPFALLVAGAPRRALAMLAVIVMSVGLGAWPLWQLQQARSVAGPAVAAIDVVSFNVLADNERSREIADYLQDAPPDVAVILETPGIEAYLGKLTAVFPYRAGCANPRSCDTAILSREPLVEPQVIPFGPTGNERLVIAGIDVAGQRVTIVAAHLSKPYFDGMAFVELRQLQEALSGIDGPVVLSGDFNAAPWADAMVELAKQADLLPPSWAPATWPVPLGDLGIPIDNMFTRGPARIASLGAIPGAMGSNHRGLRARVDLFFD